MSAAQVPGPDRNDASSLELAQGLQRSASLSFGLPSSPLRLQVAALRSAQGLARNS